MEKFLEVVSAGMMEFETDQFGNKFWINEKGQIHRSDGPAVEYTNGSKIWFQNGVRHRDDGPAVESSNGKKEYWYNDKKYSKIKNDAEWKGFVNGSKMINSKINEYGDKIWKNEKGYFHREDGPAIESTDGARFWYWNGKCHREGGPAKEYGNGHKEWYCKGNLHRADGPAIEHSNGQKEYWYNNKKYSKIKNDAEWKDFINLMKPKIGNQLGLNIFDVISGPLFPNGAVVAGWTNSGYPIVAVEYTKQVYNALGAVYLRKSDFPDAKFFPQFKGSKRTLGYTAITKDCVFDKMKVKESQFNIGQEAICKYTLNPEECLVVGFVNNFPVVAFRKSSKTPAAWNFKTLSRPDVIIYDEEWLEKAEKMGYDLTKCLCLTEETYLQKIEVSNTVPTEDLSTKGMNAVMSEKNDKDKNVDGVLARMRKSASKSPYRVARMQALTNGKDAVLNLMRGKLDEGTYSTFEMFLNSDVGQGALLGLIGVAGPMVPKYGSDPRVQMLCEEFLDEGVAKGFNEVTNLMGAILGPALASALASLPPVAEAAAEKSERTRVSHPELHEEEVQEEHEEIKSKKASKF